MIRKTLLSLIPLCCLLGCNTAIADFFGQYNMHTLTYRLSPISIPETVGGTSEWTDYGSIYYETTYSDAFGASIVLTFNGTLMSDGKTFVTNNPGVGIQYKLHLYDTAGLTPSSDITEMPFRYDMTGHAFPPVFWGGNYLHLYYRLVRLTEMVPAGKITALPDVYVAFTNAPEDSDHPGASGLLLSGINSQPKIVACNINAPSEIKLPTLYGNTITNGAQNITEVPTITLENCPGAIDGISYNFSAVYGAHEASNGVLNTVTGEGYAENVYIQIQNADGTAHKVNNPIALSDYNGSGNYKIPDFKVAYYVDDAETVRSGNVKTAIELEVTYN